MALALDIDEFCGAARISRRHLFNLWKRGQGPIKNYCGNKILITPENAKAWIESLPTERAA